MEEPIDRLTTQSTGTDEAQTDKPPGVPQLPVAEPGSGAEADPATDNAQTTSTGQANNRVSNEDGSKWESVLFPGPEIRFTPLLDLARPAADGKIYVIRMERTENVTKDGEPREKSVHITYGSEIEHNGRAHRVPRLPLVLHRSLTLPRGAQPYGSTRKLFDSIFALLRNHAMLPEKECALVAYWSMATWFLDFLPFIPSLAVTGPAFSADLLLRTLVAVCRRPVALADVNPAVVRALPLGELMPTLLIREPQLSKRMAALLDASNQPGYLVCSGTGVQELYCAKCIYMGEQANNQLLRPNAIHVHVGGHTRRVLPPLPTDDVIQDFQKRLLFYRFVWHDAVAVSKVRVPGFRFRPEVSAMAQVLGASVMEDPELQRGIIELLQDRDEQSRVDRASGQDGLVLKAVLWHCHQPDAQQVFVREIAATANRMYGEEGESLKISSETVGHMLKNLGLYTRRLGNAGRGLVLDKTIQARAHELGYAHDVLTVGVEAAVCGYCHKLQVLQTQEVV